MSDTRTRLTRGVFVLHRMRLQLWSCLLDDFLFDFLGKIVIEIGTKQRNLIVVNDDFH
jgi:hypothetical protein